MSNDLWLKFIHPDDREKTIAVSNRHLEGVTSSIEIESRLKHKSGRWIWVLDRRKVVERGDGGQPMRVIGVQADIMKQKKAEALLSLSRERTKMALDIAKVGLWHFGSETETLV